jgi:hypothetical protein
MFVSGLLAASLLAVGCSGAQNSEILVTDVDHSAVKRQSIGNCWLYAQASWLESAYKVANGTELDVSESYWTWWHWYEQIVDSNIDEINTGGTWRTSANIILKHGYVLEGEFIAAEAGAEMSAAQARAESYINEQLAEGGDLEDADSRTPAAVRRALDEAFGSNMAAAEAIAQDPSNVRIAKKGGGTSTLRDALSGANAERWTQVSFPRVYGKDATVSRTVAKRRKDLMVRVMKALNDKQPVVMSFMVDFNALDTADTMFKMSLLKQNGRGRQGGHMVVLEDYTVKNVPGVGEIGEGEVSDELKAKALKGDVVTLKAKNSWGSNRPDRGLTDGYNRFDWEYLAGQWEWDSSFGGTFWYTTLTDFVLPPGY